MDATIMQTLILVSLSLFTSIVTLFTGFGVGTIMMPVMALFFDIKVAIFLAAIVHLFNNLSRIALYHRFMRWEIIRRFGVVSIVGAFVGSFAQLTVDSGWLKNGVGLFLALFAILSLRPGSINWKLPVIIDVIGGFSVRFGRRTDRQSGCDPVFVSAELQAGKTGIDCFRRADCGRH